jgi:hypothetical protein
MELDVESSVGPPGLCALSVDTMIAHAQRRREPFGFEHLIPELHEHALLLCVNVFKDKMRSAEHAWTDLERIVGARGFEPGRFVETARRARAETLAFVVAEWMVRERACEAWRPLVEMLSPPSRPRYAQLVRGLAARGRWGAATTVVARVACDDPVQRVRALAALARRVVSG